MREWAENIWQKLEKKLEYTVRNTDERVFAYTTKNGKFVNDFDVSWWTNGFWPGILWLMYSETQNPLYRERAEILEKELEKPLYEFEKIDHDVGFMYLLSSVANYRLTGNNESKRKGLLASSLLASRYNDAGKFIRAWNGKHVTGYAIIDCMMNIPLLYWASRELCDPRFEFIAKNHADTVLKTFIRDDGSVNHINCFNAETGEFIETLKGQGYEVGSSWTRGQAWAIYGFVLSYIYTKQQKYLDAAKKVAHYFIASLSAKDDFVPDCDFRAPKEPLYKDTTAGVIAACGLIEISKCVGTYEKDMYLNSAFKILKETEMRYANWSNDEASIIQMGTQAYDTGQNMPIIYGDYFFIEAILKLKGTKILLW